MLSIRCCYYIRIFRFITLSKSKTKEIIISYRSREGITWLQKRIATKWVIGGGIVLAAIIVMSLLSINANSVYFFTPDEAVAQASDLQEKKIKVGGMVQPGSRDWTPKDLDLKFTLTDFKGHDIKVAYKGTPPDMFKEGSGVVVEGHIAQDGKSFVAQTLLVKHSEEYKKPDEGHSYDKELIKESMLKK